MESESSGDRVGLEERVLDSRLDPQADGQKGVRLVWDTPVRARSSIPSYLALLENMSWAAFQFCFIFFP